jgi:phosphoribosyl 1,2-cyclic phosphodiesterase
VRFSSLGSGSRGNGTLIEQGDTCVLVDCGFSAREAEKRLARLGKSAEDLTAILVTHEHSDHINGVGVLARKYSLPVWATSGTLYKNSQSAREKVTDRLGDGVDVHTVCSHTSFSVGDIEIQPFPVPHDAREPCQFVFGNGDKRIGLLTDVGSYTPHIEEQLSVCDALILECNDLGHLSNVQAADILNRLDTSKLNCLVAAHLSEKHNEPSLAQQSLADVLGCELDWVLVADQYAGLDWQEV